MKKPHYYFDMSKETYDFIINKGILRESEKDLLKEIVKGKTVKELASENNCCNMTICRKRKIII